MSDFLRDIAGEKWSAIALQVAILAANAHFLLSDTTNCFLALSAVLVISLFSLQVVSRRFLLLYPVRLDFKVSVPAGDTHILRIFLIASLLFLVLGSAVQAAITQGSQDLEDFFRKLFPPEWSLVFISVVATLFIVILPVIWTRCWRKKAEKKITDTVRQLGPARHYEPCPLAKKDRSHYREITRELVDDDKVKTTVKCKHCDYELTEFEPFRISY